MKLPWDTGATVKRPRLPEVPDQLLCENAEKSRRNLVFGISIWVLVAPMGLAPREIQWLGITFEDASISPEGLIVILISYLWISYVVVSRRDWSKWKRAILEELDKIQSEIASQREYLDTVTPQFKAISKPKIESEAIGLMCPGASGPYEVHNQFNEWQVEIERKRLDLSYSLKTRREFGAQVLPPTALTFLLPYISILIPIEAAMMYLNQ